MEVGTAFRRIISLLPVFLSVILLSGCLGESVIESGPAPIAPPETIIIESEAQLAPPPRILNLRRNRNSKKNPNTFITTLLNKTVTQLTRR